MSPQKGVAAVERRPLFDLQTENPVELLRQDLTSRFGVQSNRSQAAWRPITATRMLRRTGCLEAKTAERPPDASNSRSATMPASGSTQAYLGRARADVDDEFAHAWHLIRPDPVADIGRVVPELSGVLPVTQPLVSHVLANVGSF